MKLQKLLSAAAWQIFVSVIALTAAARTASAEPVTLICQLDGVINHVTAYIEDEQTTVELDEPRGTVSVHFGPFHLSPSVGIGNFPASSIGPVPATFTASAVSFSGGAINRLTGELRSSETKVPGGYGRYTCELGKAKF